VTSIYVILRLVCLLGTLYLFGGSYSNDIGFDHDKVCRMQAECVSLSPALLTTLRLARPICAFHSACVRRLKHEASLFKRHAVAAGSLACVRHSLIAAAIEYCAQHPGVPLRRCRRVTVEAGSFTSRMPTPVMSFTSSPKNPGTCRATT
jgi:hypothetical protein